MPTPTLLLTKVGRRTCSTKYLVSRVRLRARKMARHLRTSTKKKLCLSNPKSPNRSTSNSSRWNNPQHKKKAWTQCWLKNAAATTLWSKSWARKSNCTWMQTEVGLLWTKTWKTWATACCATKCRCPGLRKKAADSCLSNHSRTGWSTCPKESTSSTNGRAAARRCASGWVVSSSRRHSLPDSSRILHASRSKPLTLLSSNSSWSTTSSTWTKLKNQHPKVGRSADCTLKAACTTPRRAS